MKKSVFNVRSDTFAFFWFASLDSWFCTFYWFFRDFSVINIMSEITPDQFKNKNNTLNVFKRVSSRGHNKHHHYTALQQNCLPFMALFERNSLSNKVYFHTKDEIQSQVSFTPYAVQSVPYRGTSDNHECPRKPIERCEKKMQKCQLWSNGDDGTVVILIISVDEVAIRKLSSASSQRVDQPIIVEPIQYSIYTSSIYKL